MPASQYGTYQVVPAPGGAWHVYPNGRRVFVRARASTATATTPGTPAAEAAPGAPAQVAPDSSYFQWDAAALAKKQGDLAENAQQGTRNKTTFETALRKLREQQPRDEQSARVGANRQGLFYSSTLGNQLGGIAKQYVERQAQTQGSFDEAERARNAARAAIEAGYGVDQAAQYAASLDRQIGRDQSAADAGALVREGTGDVEGSSVSTRTPAAAKGWKAVIRGGWVWHVWPDGRQVKVRRATAR